MRLPAFITRALLRRVVRIMGSRPPDMVIGGADDPYMRRWFAIPRNRVFNIYLHHFLRSDDDRALHDHPWWNVSILLEGSYVEHTIPAGGVNVRTRYEAGAIKFRGAKSAHRVELDVNRGMGLPYHKTCKTIFITGPRIRSWGFHCPQGWRHWRQFTDPKDLGSIGRGCE